MLRCNNKELVEVVAGLRCAARLCHDEAVARGWWTDLETGKPKDRNFGELIALCHSELSEALEGKRKDLQDKHLPEYKAVLCELVDCLIRIFDLLGSQGWADDLGEVFIKKLIYNAKRADHSIEARKGQNGKAF